MHGWLMNLYWVWHHNYSSVTNVFLVDWRTDWTSLMQLDLHFNDGNWFWQTSVSFYCRIITIPRCFSGQNEIIITLQFHLQDLFETARVCSCTALCWRHRHQQHTGANELPSNPMLSNAPVIVSNKNWYIIRIRQYFSLSLSSKTLLNIALFHAYHYNG